MQTASTLPTRAGCMLLVQCYRIAFSLLILSFPPARARCRNVSVDRNLM